jgi:hypothetical protein
LAGSVKDMSLTNDDKNIVEECGLLGCGAVKASNRTKILLII